MSTTAKPELAQQYRKKPNSRTIWIVGDAEMADQLQALREELSRKRVRLEAQRPESRLIPDLEHEVAELEAKTAQLEADLRECSLKCVVQAMGAKSFEKLMNAHPPTDQQVQEAKNEDPPTEIPSFNPETFPQELIGRCIIHPVRNTTAVDEPLSEEVQDFVDWVFGDDWNQVEQLDLFNACLSVNLARRNINLGKD